MIASYNASAVQTYITISSLAIIRNKNNIFSSPFHKTSILLITGVEVVNAAAVGLAPGIKTALAVRIWLPRQTLLAVVNEKDYEPFNHLREYEASDINNIFLSL
jgi:hypothetical protein